MLENRKKMGCIVLEDDVVMHSSGRMSFMNYNPEVDALNNQHQARLQQAEAGKAEQDDVSAKEMAQVLGKRKQLPAARSPPIAQKAATSQDPVQVRISNWLPSNTYLCA